MNSFDMFVGGMIGGFVMLGLFVLVNFGVFDTQAEDPWFAEVERLRPYVEEVTKCDNENWSIGADSGDYKFKETRWSCSIDCDMWYYEELSNGEEALICAKDLINQQIPQGNFTWSEPID